MRGRILQYLKSTDLSFQRGFRHRTPRYCASHDHPAFELVYHRKGSGTTTDGDLRQTAFREGGTVIYPPRMAHDQTLAGKGEDICVHVGFGVEPPSDLMSTLYVPKTDARSRAEMLALSLTSSNVPASKRLELDHRAAALLVGLLDRTGAFETQRNQPPAERYAVAAREFVRENYRSIERIEQAAEAAGIGYDHLRHAFRKRYGISIKRWHLEVRVQHARDLLSHTSLPLKTVADACGFATERYFSTSFRKLAGTTPGKYRASHGA